MMPSNDADQPKLPTLLALRRKTPWTSRDVTEAAGMPLPIEYVMEIGGMVAFSRLTGQEYWLHNVSVNLIQHAARLPDQPPRTAHAACRHPALRKVLL
jgi:hypothetical protein